ncbi:DUF169 domain-containing protein [Comamonas badia]|uniref:DUF169 domain-containing protein n=1 Tax=Comamonas badia TaxID=265291 RepID=UPI000466B404|nr:DUF169 domain-containing protein [Comamonas badia]
MTHAAPASLSAADGAALTDALMRLLRLKTTPIVMQMFASVAEMEAVPRIRRPSHVHTTDQIVGQAARLGFTVGITVDDLVGPQCSAVLGLSPRDAAFERGEDFAGVWFDTVEDASAHQKAMHTAPYGRWTAMAVSPLNSGRLTAPQIALVYANPAQMILLINGLQHSGYRKLEWGAVGESACADSWGRALATGEPSLSIPCFPERRYGGVADDELLLALQPADLAKAVAGLERLSANGLRYPIPPYGVQMDVRAGMQRSYGAKKG